MRLVSCSLVILVACGGGKSDPTRTVRGFIGAVEAGDVEQARTYLPDDAACDRAAPRNVVDCKLSAQMMRDAMPRLVRTFPKGHVTRVERGVGPIWAVDIDGAPAADVGVMILDGQTYVLTVSLAKERPTSH